MPTFKYEALDTSGNEVKDSVEASNESEAQQKVKSMGYFVTKLTAVAGGKGGKGKKKKTGKSRKTFTIGGVSQKMLTQTLRRMEAGGLVERAVIDPAPPQHVEYRLSALGETLAEPLVALCRWAMTHGAPRS